MSPTPDWEAIRVECPAVSKRVYLNTAGGCAISRAVAEAGKRYYDEALEDGDVHWEAWLDRAERARGQVASLLNAPPRCVGLLSNASTALDIAHRLFAAEERPGLITGEHEFPSLTLPWINAGRRVRFMELKADLSVDLSLVREKDLHDVGTFGFSHVGYHTGFRYDLDAAVGFAKAHGLLTVIDATQSLGAFPIDVNRLDIDCLVFSGYKWTGAGYGVAGLYLKPQVLASRRLPSVGWRSTSSPYEMVFDQFVRAEGTPALELGHPPFAGAFALGAAVAQIRAHGIESIAARLLSLTQTLHRGVDAQGFEIASSRDPKHVSQITLIRVDDAKSAVEFLSRRGIVVDHVRGLVRVSPHVYNNETDIQALVQGLAAYRALVRSG